MYLLCKTANDMPEFRWRIRGGKVVEHEVVHPSCTILTENDLFTFCTIPYSEPYSRFAAAAAERIAWKKDHPSLYDEPEQDDLLYLSGLPWVSFTGISQPIHMHPVDSIPRITWGKYFIEQDRVQLPLSVQVHHALMDGIHASRYILKFHEIAEKPGQFLT
jgi:chloramphenicol O-acetyltransferase type A